MQQVPKAEQALALKQEARPHRPPEATFEARPEDSRQVNPQSLFEIPSFSNNKFIIRKCLNLNLAFCQASSAGR